MIKLIITSDSSPQTTYRFSQSSIIIGGEQALDADLKLSGESLLDRHIQIIRQLSDGKNEYSVINLANDPFVTLNNLPFGKQPLCANDLIQVGDISLRFEYEFEPEYGELSLFDENRLQEQNKGKPNENIGYAPPHPLEKPDNPALKNRRTFKPSPIDESSPKAANADFTYPYNQGPDFQLPEKNTSAKAASASQPSHSQKQSLKDYYLSEYDDNDESAASPFDKSAKQYISPQFAKSWRTFLTFFAGVIGVFTIFFGILYLWISDQTGEEETKAAKGVADIAMALTYAQMKNIHPQNQNWSYPEFINNNLTSILAPNYLSLGNIDAHGQFADSPYMLRIHTSSDLSQFLVIAQPTPSLLQWLIPKASIVVDSHVMEIRKITDLRALNRLIVNSNNLDGANSHEISNLVKQGKLIPLSRLISKAENQGLSPPKALSLIRPGAENLIYNAPRYYLLGETILNNSINLVEKLAGMREIGMLQQELNYLLNFPDFVLYSSNGIQQALKGQKALGTIVPSDKYLIAYLQLNTHGKIADTYLLMDDSPSDIAIGDSQKKSFLESGNDFVAEDLSSNVQDEQALDKQTETIDFEISPNVDTDHPLFHQLSSLANIRQFTLKPITEEIIVLLKKQAKSAQSEFDSQMAKLQQKYLEASKEEQNKIFAKFKTITHDNAYLPAATFLEFIKSANLKVLFQTYLKELKEKSNDKQLSTEKIEQQFLLVQESQTWDDLEKHAAQINQLLQFDHVSDSERLVALQNSARSQVTQKLNHFILSSSEALPSNAFNPDHLQTLTNILKLIWITDPDTHDFYIAEFELREPGHA